MNGQKLDRFESIIDRYQQGLFRFAFFRTGSVGDSQDIVQNVFLRLYDRHGDFAAIENMKSYLYRSVSNACSDHRRRQQSIKTVPLANAALKTAEETDDAAVKEYERINTLLDPAIVPMREKAAMTEGVKYFVEETGDETVLTADVKARGDFSNPYLRNSSIEESDTRREIVFDRETGLLKSLKIFVKVAGVKVLVVDVKNIDYNVPVDSGALLALPAGYDWLDVTATPPAGRFAGITVEEAARLIADAIDAGDMGSVSEAFIKFDPEFIEETFEGAKVICVGKPFRSGTYPGVFVPYKIRLADGTVYKPNIALRNDNPNGVWLVDGGL